MKVIIDRGFAARLIGRDPRDVEAIWAEFREIDVLDGQWRHRHLRASAPSTWRCGTSPGAWPGCRSIGCSAASGATAVRAASSIIFDTANLDGLGRQFADLRARGYGVLKGGWGHDLSIAFGRDPRRDVAIVRTVREAVGDDAEIIVDVAAGSGWTREPRHHHGAGLRAVSALLARGRAGRGRPRRLEAARAGDGDAAVHRREGLDGAALPPAHRQRARSTSS